MKMGPKCGPETSVTKYHLGWDMGVFFIHFHSYTKHWWVKNAYKDIRVYSTEQEQ
jgi:hypothetical protein